MYILYLQYSYLLDAFLGFLVIIALACLFVPLFYYLGPVLKNRKAEILNSFSDSALEEYFITFFPASYNLSKTTLSGSGIGNIIDQSKKSSNEKEKSIFLRSLFKDCCGKNLSAKRFAVPLITLLFHCALGLVFASVAIRPFLLQIFRIEVELPDFKWYHFGAIASFAGGYMWVAQYIIRRVQQRRLSPYNIFYAVFRLLISVPVALALSAFVQNILSPSMLCAFCFMLGALPTDYLLMLMRKVAIARTGIPQQTTEVSSGLLNLQGITKKQVEDFQNEGIETILQLAYADPIDITVRTGYSFSYIIDCCSQALAWLTFEERMQVLRKYGLRGAMEVTTFEREIDRDYDQDENTTDQEVSMATKTLESIAKDLNMEKDVVRRMFYELAWDPYSQLFYNIWQTECN
jgi:hypothetical protein